VLLAARSIALSHQQIVNRDGANRTWRAAYRQIAAAIEQQLKQMRSNVAAFDTLVTMFGAEFAGSSPRTGHSRQRMNWR
jgi:hypothetical protein